AGLGAAQAETGKQHADRAANLRRINELKVTLKLEEASERQALESLFKKVELNYLYIVDPLIDTRISLAVEDVPFEGALVSILRSVRRDPLSYQPDEQIILSVTPDRHMGVTTNLPGRRVWLDFDHVDVRYALK